MLLTPMTSPAMLTKGPPELPGLIAASVWMKSNPGAATESGAPLRLTIPNETVCSRPNGWPSASTSSPTRTRFESPRGSTGRLLAPSILIRARSTRSSLPATLPANRRPSASRIWMASPTSTTWAFVTSRPAALMKKPEPVPRRASLGGSGFSLAVPPLLRPTRTWTSAGLSRSASWLSRSSKRASSGAAWASADSVQSAGSAARAGAAQPTASRTVATRATVVAGESTRIRPSFDFPSSIAAPSPRA